MSDTACQAEQGQRHLRLREIGTKAFRHFLLESGDNLIGSGRSCSCRLQDRGISRRHAVIHVGPESCFVEDLDSKNGTLVDDRSIQKQELKPGAELAFGATSWRLEVVLDDDVQLAVEVAPSSRHEEQTTLHEETLPLDEEAPSLPPGVVLPSGIIVGSSPAMVEVYERIAALQRSDTAVLITGETGVGKEHLAHALHLSSTRHAGPFIAINCAALPGDLLEAELFGVGKGVATGVVARRGKVREAAGGTLFLDEVGELQHPLQAKLLRILQEKEVAALGERAEAVDVRFVAATNVDLGERIADGEFRADLFYRLAGYDLAIPPLRERAADLPLLAGHFVREGNRETGKRVRGLTVKAMSILLQRPWPGNVRQLQNEVRRLVIQCPDGQAIDSGMLTRAHQQSLGPVELLADRLELGAEPLGRVLERLERRLVERALEQSGENQSAAARLLGVSRNGLAMRIKRLRSGS